MEKIRIITDSASDLPSMPETDITVLPMRINFGEEEYLDGVTISHHEFYEKLIESDTLPVTSLISPAVFEEAYKKAVDAGEKVIVITISGKLSGTYQSAALAAAQFEGSVFVIDSLNAAIGEQVLVRYALQLAKADMPVEEIVAQLEKSKKNIHILALLDTLEYLKKGG
ncbi:MAG: DegV family protein, partial [Alistipes sp.]|nr:DegV family protein [Alistipes sp.]